MSQAVITKSDTSFVSLYQVLLKKDLLKAGVSAVDGRPSKNKLEDLINEGELLLPTVFSSAYAEPLKQRIPALLAQVQSRRLPLSLIETLCGAVYQFADTSLEPDLTRFLAVIADLYTSFLDKTKRRSLNVPLAETLPPMAVWQSDPSSGPFTIPIDQASRLIGASVGVVSQPFGFAGHPFLYAALTHETGGHDVIHADADLMPELRQGVYALFPDSQSWLGLLWDHWMDEVAADVYGIINMGPAFAASFAALISVFLDQGRGRTQPMLRTFSGGGPDGLDVHPTDVLRLSAAQGVIAQLAGLSPATRQQYIQSIDEIIALCIGDANTIQLQGTAIGYDGRTLDFNNAFPLNSMQSAAKQVGAYIATVRLDALAGASIQDIETWDDGDENVAATIGSKLLQKQSVIAAGDDAQLIAGLTQALLQRPDDDTYDDASKSVNEALDNSFSNDPYWGTSTQDKWVLIEPAISLKYKPEPDPYAVSIITHNALDEIPGSMIGTEAAVEIHRFNDIPWPKGTAPATSTLAIHPDKALSPCDAIVFTYTVDEANALAAVMTPNIQAVPGKNHKTGKNQKNGSVWQEYNHLLSEYESQLTMRSPAKSARNLGVGHYMTLNGLKVLCFKSSLHLSTDGEEMPIKQLVQQICKETRARLFITTGTAGGIGSKVRLGDTVIATSTCLKLERRFRDNPNNGKTFTSFFEWDKLDFVDTANKSLLPANDMYLPTGARPSKILTGPNVFGDPNVVVTTDAFLFDDAGNKDGLQGLGSMVEMDDAIVALAIHELGNAPVWLSIRNASDPQMPEDSTPDDASSIYKRYGFYTTISSALGCWAAIMGGKF